MWRDPDSTPLAISVPVPLLEVSVRINWQASIPYRKVLRLEFGAAGEAGVSAQSAAGQGSKAELGIATMGLNAQAIP